MFKDSPDSVLVYISCISGSPHVIPAGVPGVHVLPVLTAPVSAWQHSALEHQLSLDAAGGAPRYGT